MLRLRDEKRSDGTFVRVLDCTVCGRLELELDPQTLSPELVHRLSSEGVLVGIKEEELAEVRKAAMKKLRSGE